VKCHYCGAEADTMDHLIPKSFNGTMKVPACRECNQKKADMFWTICMDCRLKAFRKKGSKCDCGGKITLIF
jgi:5-methylcytosine-specific restriction endonuclease McrA